MACGQTDMSQLAIPDTVRSRTVHMAVVYAQSVDTPVSSQTLLNKFTRNFVYGKNSVTCNFNVDKEAKPEIITNFSSNQQVAVPDNKTKL